MRNRQKFVIIPGILLISIGLAWINSSNTVYAQLATQAPPTQAMATVTGTPAGAMITVNADQDQINVRECPNTTTCGIIGVLLPGQQLPALGRSPGGEWIMIQYPHPPDGTAWVHSSLVTVSPGFLQIIF